MRKRLSADFRHNLELMSMNLPTVLWVLIFSYLPMIGLVLAFKDYRYDLGIIGSEWVGLQNFDFLFSSNNAWRITRNTVGMNFMFIVTGPIFGILFAVLLNEITKRFIKIYQTVIFFPYYLSWVVVGYAFIGLFDMESGLINRLIMKFGGEAIMWYNEPKYWPYILLITYIWKHVGFTSILYYTTIIGISRDYYEAAEIDGATKLQQIRFITLPLLVPTVIILMLLDIGNIFRADFGMFYFLTQNSGALYETTDVIDTYVFRTLRELGDIGMGTAAGLFQGGVGLLLVLTVNWIVRKFNRENALY